MLSFVDNIDFVIIYCHFKLIHCSKKKAFIKYANRVANSES